MVSRTLVYNSWRHFYFCYGAIILLAVYGLEELSEGAERLMLKRKKMAVKGSGGAIVYVVAAFCLVFTAGQSLYNHPYEYAYFNVIAGQGIEEQYEIDYWTVGGKSALEELYACLEREEGQEAERDGEAETAENDGAVLVSACDITTLIGVENGWVNLPSGKRERIACTDNWQEADYVLVNSTYSAIEELCGNPDNQYLKENYEKIAQISAYGNVIWSIFKK